MSDADDDDNHGGSGGGGERNSDRHKRRRRSHSAAMPSFGIAPADIVTNLNRRLAKKTHLRDLAELDSVESLVVASRPGLLREMSAKIIGPEPLEQSIFSFTVIRECEQLLEAYSGPGGGGGDGVTTERDIERVERRADDFMLRNRETTEHRHRMRLWVARCKLASLRAAMRENCTAGGAESSASASTSEDAIRAAAKMINDVMLARWMSESGVGDSSVVRRDERTGEWQHALSRCGLSALWATIRSLRDRWPHLRVSPFLYVIVERLRDRVAFFMNYREPVNAQTETAQKLRSVKILGLARSSWHVSDPEWVRGSKFSGPAAAAAAAAARRDNSLLNSPEMTRTVTTADGVRYACVNDDFIEETERVLNSMLIELRRCAGFEWHEHAERTENDCFACAELASRAGAVSELGSATLELERLVSAEVSGNFRDYVQLEFRAHIWDAYLQPGERELFVTYRPLDNDTAQSVISRGRPADGKNISRRCCERSVVQVWSEFAPPGTLAPTPATSTAGAAGAEESNPVLFDYRQRTEPACSLITRLTLGFYLDSLSNGSQFSVYTIDCQSSNDPFAYGDERFGRHRMLYTEFHTPMVTTGTLCWRYKHMRRTGLRAPEAEMYYEHPLIMRTMANFCVLYNGRMHLCASYAEAFIVWLATMCEDPKIGGETSRDFSLLPFYERLFPSRREHIAALRRETETRKRAWDPLSSVFPRDVLTEQPAQAHNRLQY